MNKNNHEIEKFKVDFTRLFVSPNTPARALVLDFMPDWFCPERSFGPGADFIFHQHKLMARVRKVDQKIEKADNQYETLFFELDDQGHPKVNYEWPEEIVYHHVTPSFCSKFRIENITLEDSKLVFALNDFDVIWTDDRGKGANFGFKFGTTPIQNFVIFYDLIKGQFTISNEELDNKLLDFDEAVNEWGYDEMFVISYDAECKEAIKLVEDIRNLPEYIPFRSDIADIILKAKRATTRSTSVTIIEQIRPLVNSRSIRQIG